jgi:hypothetical protein
MPQLSVPFIEKLDAPLADLCNANQLSATSMIPVLVRVRSLDSEEVSRRISSVGGQVRRELRIVSALSTWLPISAVELLAALPDVEAMELEQTFSIA